MSARLTGRYSHSQYFGGLYRVNHKRDFWSIGRVALAATFVISNALLVGCGGGGGGGVGGGGGGGTASAFMTINWPERTRAGATAPQSALSVRGDLIPVGSLNPTDSAVLNRELDPAAYSDTLTISDSATGEFTLRLTFYAQLNATGSVVGTAEKLVTLVDGSNGAGDFTVSKKVFTVTIPAGQLIDIGDTETLSFTARNDEGDILALTPGSAIWTLIGGGAFVDLTEDGQATGEAEGTATVRVSIDGVTSANQTIGIVTSGGGGGPGDPTWVPGNKIFYTAVNVGDPSNIDLLHMDPDGDNQTLFFTMPPEIISAAPNPNVEDQLVFAHTQDGIVYELYRNSSLSTTGAFKLTDGDDDPFGFVGTIQVTPDGTKVMFTATLDTDNAVYTVNMNGTGLTRLDDADDAHLSQDGTLIAYSKLEGTFANVWRMGIDGSAKTRLTNTTADDDIFPQWSKNGAKITFSSNQAADLPASNFDVYTINADGSSLFRLTITEDDEFGPTYNPTGTEIAFFRVGRETPDVNGIYKRPSGGGGETELLLDPSAGGTAPFHGIYWTSTTGRAPGGLPVSVNRNLRLRKKIGK